MMRFFEGNENMVPLEFDNMDSAFKYLENLCSFFIKYKIDKEMQVMGLYNSFSFDDVAKYELFNCKVFFDLFDKINKGVQIKK